jgi:hypothetical protein
MHYKTIAAVLALACGNGVSAQTAVATVAPVVDFNRVPAAPGSWVYSAQLGASEARFIEASGTARLTLRCTRATRQVSISHASSMPSAIISVWTSSAARALPARFEPTAMRVTADLSAYDPLLDAIAFSRGRIAVTVAGGVALVVPAWPEAARTIEDCRI